MHVIAADARHDAILISAAFTAFAFVLVPMLRLGNKRQGEPANTGEQMELAGTGARGLCLCLAKSRFPTAKTGVGGDSIRML